MSHFGYLDSSGRSLKMNNQKKKEPLAIIGIGCRYPGNANTVEQFWKLICNKTDALTPIPADRWDLNALYAPDWRRAGKIHVKRGGFINDIDKFDAGFFGISPVEALKMDPQQRSLLEVTYEALENAGLDLNKLRNSPTAVFIGISAHDYSDLQQVPKERVLISAHTNVGGALSIAANRISYSFDFTGPSMAVDTACSSSLNAIHLACRALWEGDATLALAGGVNAILKPEPQMGFSRGGFLSPDGTCFSFDERANGYVRSEGTGMIVIKPLSRAEADRDTIYAVIRGTAVNQDGATKGISAPNPEAQEALLKAAYEDAGIDPHQVSYIEAHGTGTFVGDPIEGHAVGKVIGTGREDICYMGSVKSNIGHLEPAAGIAGITKLVLAMYHKQIPPNIHFVRGNPKIPFDMLKVKVPTDLLTWETHGKPRYGGVNAFGFGGSNAHIVLEGYDGTPSHDRKEVPGPMIVTISARDDNALRALAQSYIGYVHDKNRPAFRDICAASTLRRTHHNKRLAVVAVNAEEFVDSLKSWLDGKPLHNVAEGTAHDVKENVVFVFSGQGAQWWGMGRQLFEKDPLFRKHIEQLETMFASYADWSLIEELSRDEETSRISDTNIAQPAIFSLQIALSEMWKAKGIHPKAVVGYSIGEVTAAYVSGALTLEQAVKLIFHRARVQFKATDKGKMLAAAVSQKDAEQLLAGKEDRVCIAAINGPEMVTFSGDTGIIEDLAAQLQERDIFHKLLHINVPFHSQHMDPLKEELLASLGADWAPSSTTIPFYSTVEGKVVPGEHLTRAYWFRNVREPVCFTAAIEAQIRHGFDTFVEIGPHPIHAIGIEDILKNHRVKGLVLASLRRKEDEQRQFLSSVARIHAWGANVAWSNVYGVVDNSVKLPAYPWQKESYWLESEESKKARLGTIEYHPHLQQKHVSASEKNTILWDVDLDPRSYPYMNDHKVQGPIVYPGAGQMDLVASAAKASFGEQFEFVEDVNFERPLFLPDTDEPPYIQLNIRDDSREWRLYTKNRSKNAQWTLCSYGRINHIGDKFESIPLHWDEIKERLTTSVNPKLLYNELRNSGLDLGPGFRCLKNLWRAETTWEAWSEIEAHESIRDELFQFTIHPGVLDSCFQTIFGILSMPNEMIEKMGVYIPRHIARMKWHGNVNSHKLTVYGKLNVWTEEDAIADLWIYNEDGTLVAEFQGLHAQYLKGSRGESLNERDKWFYEYKWTMKLRTGRDARRNPGEYLPSPPDISEGIRETIDEIVARPANNEYYYHYEPEQHALIRTYICTALQEMGMSFEPGTQINVDELIDHMSIAPEHHRWFNHLFVLLSKMRIVRGSGRKYEVIRTPEFRDTSRWMEELDAAFPQFHHESSLLGRCGSHIQGVLQGKIDPLQLIFPEDTWDEIIRYYAEGFAFGKYNEIGRRAIAELIADLPEEQTLRVLEIGAGTGGMTNAILPILPPERTEYVFTDVSHLFLHKAKARFVRYPFITYQLLDIERDPASQGMDLNSFDVVIASDVFHATRNLKTTLGHVRQLLASQGVLMMLEVTNNPLYLDMIFGMLEGWWLFEDADIRPDHATIPPDKWQNILEGLEYTDVACYSDIPDNSVSCQTVIMARAKKDDLSSNVEENEEKIQEADWIIFADIGGTSDKIISQLHSLNKTCFTVRSGPGFHQISDTAWEIDPLSPEDVSMIFDIVNERKNFQGIVFAWGLDLFPNDRLNKDTIIEAEERAGMTLLSIMRKITETRYNQNPTIWIVTRGTQSVGGAPECVNLAQMGLRGIARTCFNEFPTYRTTLVDFSDSVQDCEIDMFIYEIFANNVVEEVAYRGRKRYVVRLERLAPDIIAEKAIRTVPAQGSAYHATLYDHGVLDHITLQETTRKTPASGHVEIRIISAGLNFRDIMMAMGLLSDESVESGLFGKTFGLECSGVVSAVGKGVMEWNVGDEVIALAPSSLGGFAYAKKQHIVRKPVHLSFEQAACLPMAYMTAYYSLIHKCGLAAGEKVLIHAAAGGVGSAAIQIAKAVGAEVYATVSTQEKRDYIIGLGVKPGNIMHSRTLAFADELMEKTGGYGVDVVLNSLSGEAIYKSLRCLAAFGRFIELGKTDIYKNTRLGLKPFGNNLAYFGVDIDRFLLQRVGQSGAILRACMEFFEQNNLTPHSYTAFPIGRLTDAFQFMASGRHNGKVVVSMEGEVNIAPQTEIAFDPEGTYIITGGASGLGLAVASWMTTKGCKHLALMNRSGTKTPEEALLVEAMREKGVNVRLVTGSVDSEEDVQRVFKNIAGHMPPIKGIQHAAMVLDDVEIPDIDRERYMSVFTPKAVGAWLLHEACKEMELDHFVLYSSISSVYGNPGQVSYVAANSFLDNFSYWRRAQGLPATTVNWGVIGETGFVHRAGTMVNLLSKQGWKPFSLKEATEILEQMLLNKPIQRIATNSDWKSIGGFYPYIVNSPRFGHLVKEEESNASSGGEAARSGDGELRRHILASKSEEQFDIVLRWVKDTFARVLGAAPDKLPPKMPVTDYGLDSLMANQIRGWIQSSFQIDYSIMKIMRGPTMEEMSEHILGETLWQGGGVEIGGESKSELDTWIIRAKKGENPRLRLFCLPFSGGGASIFTTWHESLPSDVEVCAIQMPGREERNHEKPFDDLHELLKKMADIMKPLLTTPIAFYAHSFGAGIAFELVRYLRKEFNIHPTVFMIGGFRAPQLEKPFEYIDIVDDEDVYNEKNIINIKNFMRRVGISDAMLENEEVSHEILPSLWADILIAKRYSYYEDDKFDCPIIAFAGSEDNVCGADQIRAWKEQTAGDFKFIMVNGGHLFCRDNKEELLETIAAQLAEELVV